MCGAFVPIAKIIHIEKLNISLILGASPVRATFRNSNGIILDHCEKAFAIASLNFLSIFQKFKIYTQSLPSIVP